MAFPSEFCIRNVLQARPAVQTAELFLQRRLRNAFQLGGRRKLVSGLGLPCLAQLGYGVPSNERGERLEEMVRFFFPLHCDARVRTESERGLPALPLREQLFLQFSLMRSSVSHSELTPPSMSHVLLWPPAFVDPPTNDGVRAFTGAKRRAIHLTIEQGQQLCHGIRSVRLLSCARRVWAWALCAGRQCLFVQGNAHTAVHVSKTRSRCM